MNGYTCVLHYIGCAGHSSAFFNSRTEYKQMNHCHYTDLCIGYNPTVAEVLQVSEAKKCTLISKVQLKFFGILFLHGTWDTLFPVVVSHTRTLERCCIRKCFLIKFWNSQTSQSEVWAQFNKEMACTFLASCRVHSCEFQHEKTWFNKIHVPL